MDDEDSDGSRIAMLVSEDRIGRNSDESPTRPMPNLLSRSRDGISFYHCHSAGTSSASSSSKREKKEKRVVRENPNLRHLRSSLPHYREQTLEQLLAATSVPSNEFCGFRGFELLPGFHEETEELDDLFNLQLAINTSCFMCNGFYAQNHGEATCSICHAFLFPHFSEDPGLKSLKEDSDSDSGNDEPQDSQLFMYSSKYSREHRRSGNNGEAAKAPAVNAPEEESENVEGESSDYSGITLGTLPTEVLIIIIKYLDELSLWSLSQVNSRFAGVIAQIIPGEKWQQYSLRKWNFINRRVNTRNWYEFYSKMMFSSFCFRCVKAMSDHHLIEDEDNPWRENRLRTESRTLQLDPLEGIWAIPLDRNKYHWQACIEGPAGSPYEGGKFYLYMQVPYTYPMTPPIVRFITRIFHPNISRHGDIGIDSIQHNWSLALTVGKVLISIQSLLTDPYCNVSMEPEIAELYSTDREAFDEQASLWTWKYAMNELRY